MIQSFVYAGHSGLVERGGARAIRFAPNLAREAVAFDAPLRHPLRFREAISALHDVVVSDLRWHPKDKTAYKQWAAQQEEMALAAAASQQRAVAKQIAQVQAELEELRRRSERRTQPFLTARKKYFEYLYQRDRDAWFVLDPVITVHPD